MMGDSERAIAVRQVACRLETERNQSSDVWGNQGRMPGEHGAEATHIRVARDRPHAYRGQNEGKLAKSSADDVIAFESRQGVDDDLIYSSDMTRGELAGVEEAIVVLEVSAWIDTHLRYPLPMQRHENDIDSLGRNVRKAHVPRWQMAVLRPSGADDRRAQSSQ
jgi:hypothetical protein